MYYFYDWLKRKLATHSFQNTILFDIGAYHGDFTQQLIEFNCFSKAVLFEPNQTHYEFLKNKFAKQENIFLYPYALGNQTGLHDFNCSQDDATGSLLTYHPNYHHSATEKKVTKGSVEVMKLDEFYSTFFPDEKIGLIKIDTQGFDLEVLKGGEKMIRNQQPWLVIELNFLSFYQEQAPIHLLFNWLAEHRYTLGGFFNDHFSGDEWLAFADGVFVPEATIDKSMEPFTPRLINEEILQQNSYLQKVCAERLKLINTLHTEAENRLQLIHELTKKLDNSAEKMVPTEIPNKKWYQF